MGRAPQKGMAAAMPRTRRRLNRARDTRDPAVAAEYTQAQQASADWTLALRQALQQAPLALTPKPLAPRQLSLPFAEPPTAAERRN